jgi:surfeit locus 1 family protein
MKRSPARVLLAALAVAALTLRLGFWQLDRAAQKTQRQQDIEQRQAMPALEPALLATHVEQLEPQLHRMVELRGHWSPAQSIFLENRQMRGRPGFYVLTPLILADGSAVIVQRGWLPRAFDDRTRVRLPPTDAGEVSLRGRIAPPPARLYEFDAAGSGPIRQNLDLDAFAAETRLRLRPLSVLQLDADGGAPEGLLRDWPQPAADVHKHYGYAFQWFALAALTIALYVWFQLLRPRRRSHDRGHAEPG